jgi:aldose 1-epimerase
MPLCGIFFVFSGGLFLGFILNFRREYGMIEPGVITMTQLTILPQKRGQTIEIRFSNQTRYRFTTIGASLVEWMHADGTELVCGYQDLAMYGTGGQYLGTTVGPTAGRIEHGRFVMDGKDILVKESSKHFLHGGVEGLHNVDFKIACATAGDHSAVVTFSTTYQHSVIPGRIAFQVTYLLEENGFRLAFDATTDQPTLFNVTNHSYFSLLGRYDGDLLEHDLELDASRVILVDDDIIGREIQDVAGTVFDFLRPTSLRTALSDSGLKAQGARGIDHCFLLDHKKTDQLRLSSKHTIKVLTIQTSYPGLTLYTTNYPKPDMIQNGRSLRLHGALAIEPQFPSNGINDPRFHDLILRPGDHYRHFIDYRMTEVRS